MFVSEKIDQKITSYAMALFYEKKYWLKILVYKSEKENYYWLINFSIQKCYFEGRILLLILDIYFSLSRETI